MIWQSCDGYHHHHHHSPAAAGIRSVCPEPPLRYTVTTATCPPSTRGKSVTACPLQQGTPFVLFPRLARGVNYDGPSLGHSRI